MSQSGEIPIKRDSEVYDLYADEAEEMEDMKIGVFTPMLAIDPNEIEFKKIARIEKQFTDIPNFENFVISTDERIQMVHPNVVRMLDYAYEAIDDNITAFETHGFYELCETDLREEIGERYENGINFTDLQIYNIIKNVISGLAFLQRKNIIHGDMSYEGISDDPDNENLTCKIIGRMASPIPPHLIQLENIRNEVDLYMDPGYFESLIKTSPIIKVNPFKQDVFALGLIILSCGIFQENSDLYDIEEGVFRYDLLQEKIQDFIQNYDDSILIQLIEILLEVKEEKRLTPIQIEKKIKIILENLDPENEEENIGNEQESVETKKKETIKRKVESENSEDEEGSRNESESGSDSNKSSSKNEDSESESEKEEEENSLKENLMLPSETGSEKERESNRKRIQLDNEMEKNDENVEISEDQKENEEEMIDLQKSEENVEEVAIMSDQEHGEDLKSEDNKQERENVDEVFSEKEDDVEEVAIMSDQEHGDNVKLEEDQDLEVETLEENENLKDEGMELESNENTSERKVNKSESRKLLEKDSKENLEFESGEENFEEIQIEEVSQKLKDEKEELELNNEEDFDQENFEVNDSLKEEEEEIPVEEPEIVEEIDLGQETEEIEEENLNKQSDFDRIISLKDEKNEDSEEENVLENEIEKEAQEKRNPNENQEAVEPVEEVVLENDNQEEQEAVSKAIPNQEPEFAENEEEFVVEEVVIGNNNDNLESEEEKLNLAQPMQEEEQQEEFDDDFGFARNENMQAKVENRNPMMEEENQQSEEETLVEEVIMNTNRSQEEDDDLEEKDIDHEHDYVDDEIENDEQFDLVKNAQIQEIVPDELEEVIMPVQNRENNEDEEDLEEQDHHYSNDYVDEEIENDEQFDLVKNAQIAIAKQNLPQEVEEMVVEEVIMPTQNTEYIDDGDLEEEDIDHEHDYVDEEIENDEDFHLVKNTHVGIVRQSFPQEEDEEEMVVEEVMMPIQNTEDIDDGDLEEEDQDYSHDYVDEEIENDEDFHQVNNMKPRVFAKQVVNTGKNILNNMENALNPNEEIHEELMVEEVVINAQKEDIDDGDLEEEDQDYSHDYVNQEVEDDENYKAAQFDERLHLRSNVEVGNTTKAGTIQAEIDLKDPNEADIPFQEYLRQTEPQQTRENIVNQIRSQQVPIIMEPTNQRNQEEMKQVDNNLFQNRNQEIIVEIVPTAEREQVPLNQNTNQTIVVNKKHQVTREPIRYNPTEVKNDVKYEKIVVGYDYESDLENEQLAESEYLNNEPQNHQNYDISEIEKIRHKYQEIKKETQFENNNKAAMNFKVQTTPQTVVYATTTINNNNINLQIAPQNEFRENSTNFNSSKGDNTRKVSKESDYKQYNSHQINENNLVNTASSFYKNEPILSEIQNYEQIYVENKPIQTNQRFVKNEIINQSHNFNQNPNNVLREKKRRISKKLDYEVIPSIPERQPIISQNEIEEFTIEAPNKFAKDEVLYFSGQNNRISPSPETRRFTASKMPHSEISENGSMLSALIRNKSNLVQDFFVTKNPATNKKRIILDNSVSAKKSRMEKTTIKSGNYSVSQYQKDSLTQGIRNPYNSYTPKLNIKQGQQSVSARVNNYKSNNTALESSQYNDYSNLITRKKVPQYSVSSAMNEYTSIRKPNPPVNNFVNNYFSIESRTQQEPVKEYLQSNEKLTQKPNNFKQFSNFKKRKTPEKSNVLSNNKVVESILIDNKLGSPFKAEFSNIKTSLVVSNLESQKNQFMQQFSSQKKESKTTTTRNIRRKIKLSEYTCKKVTSIKKVENVVDTTRNTKNNYSYQGYTQYSNHK